MNLFNGSISFSDFILMALFYLVEGVAASFSNFILMALFYLVEGIAASFSEFILFNGSISFSVQHSRFI